ncbi:MAG TPA: AEC family transporter [Coriobacteriia bacterium]
MEFGALAQAIAKMLALAGAGVLLRLSGLLKRDDSRVLNAVIMYAALPALVFRVARQAALSWDLLRVSGIAWGVGAAAFVLAWLLARALRLPPKTAGAFMLVTALGNTGYIGYPVTTMLLGERQLPKAVFYDVFGTVALLFTVGVFVASRTGSHDGKISLAKELLSAPALIALLAGLLSRLLPLSGPVQAVVMDWLGLVANLTVPLVMMSLGLTLRGEGLRKRAASLVASGAVKLLVLPAVALGIGLAVGDRESLRLVALQAGMPSMMLTLMVGDRFELDTDLIASAILASTVACVLTVPLVQLLVR